jgi:hypothetical protein
MVSCVPGLADRLGRDDSDRFADVHRRAAGEIAPVAGGAGADLGLAGQGRAHLDRLHRRRLDHVDQRLVQVGVGGTIVSVPGSLTSSAVNGRRMREPSETSTSPPSTTARSVMPRVVPQSSSKMIESCAYVHQTTGQVAGVGRLQRRVRQALRAPWVE